jgi:hypothetical protein
MSGRTRLAVLAGLIAVAVVAFAIARSGGSNDNNKGGGAGAATRPRVIRVVKGKPLGGIQKIEVKQGSPVRLVVESDVADEVHIHGYDFHKDVARGGSVRFDFPAKISGAFVIELENAKQQIAELEVTP